MAARAAILTAILALGGVGMLLARAEPVAASCVVWGTEEEMLAGADVVLVGRVVATTNSDRWATVEVAEIWRGPDLGSVVAVQGGEGPGVGSSNDRQYAVGTDCLFALTRPDGGGLRDNACSMTTAWDDALLRFRPATARPPVDAALPSPAPEARGIDLGFAVAPAVLVVSIGILVFGAVRLAGRRAAR